jgi:hypothetical protein
MKKTGSFRAWLQNLWLENCSENDSWGQPKLTMAEYFSRYKYWLKREYRHQQKK